MITITRQSAYTDALRDYKVEIDGKVIGSIANGETEKFNIEPGVHQIRLRISWCSSEKLEFTVRKKADELHFVCRGNMVGWRGWMGILYVLLCPTNISNWNRQSLLSDKPKVRSIIKRIQLPQPVA